MFHCYLNLVSLDIHFNCSNTLNSNLPSILHPPSFDKADAYGAHPDELVDSLKSLTNGLGKMVSKLPVVEDTHVAC